MQRKHRKDIFITPDEAMKQVTPKTLLIIVDTHLRNSLESPQLYDECKRSLLLTIIAERLII